MKERKEKMRKGIKKYSPGIGKKSKNKNKGSLQAACEKTRRVISLFLSGGAHGGGGICCSVVSSGNLYAFRNDRSVPGAGACENIPASECTGTRYVCQYGIGDSGVSTPVGVLSTGICIAYTKSHLPELGDYVSVNLIGSRYENHEIQLKATITYQLPFSILPVSKIKVGNAAWYSLDGV